jgi:hypothetical protein
MAIETATKRTMEIAKMFSVGFLDDKGKNKTPDYYGDRMENLLIKNWWITPRPWHELIYSAWESYPVRWMISNAIISETRIYYVANSHFRYIDLSDSSTHDVWSIGTDNNCVLVNAWWYILIFTWASYPRHYDWTTLAQNTSSEIDTNVNPSFWAKFAWFTACNSQLNKNILYISRPITLSNQEYCYHFKWTDAQTIDLTSKLLGICSTMDAMWFFTTTNIQRLTRDNLTTTGWISSLYTVPFAEWYTGVVNHKSIVKAWDAIFFLTSNKKIATINYEGTVTTPRMRIISDKPQISIDWFMQRELDDDLSQSFWFFDEERQLVKFWVKSRKSTVPDIVIVYDLQNKTFFTFYDLFFSNVITLEWTNQIYAGGSLSHKIMQDCSWASDCGDAINRVYETTDIAPQWTSIVQTFNWVATAGQINSQAKIQRDVRVDDALAVWKTILGSRYTWVVSRGIGSFAIWAEPIWWYSTGVLDDLIDFEVDMWVESLRFTGKKLKSVFSWGTLWEDFVLDKYSITFTPRVRKLRSDKL